MTSSGLARYWYAKSKEIFKSPHMSVAQKLLAYKIFLRPLLVYDWFEGRNNELKRFEVKALKHIFGSSNEIRLYEKFTDIDVTAYMKLQEIRWNRGTGLDTRDIRSKLFMFSRRSNDPTSYYIRASDKHRHSCRRLHNVSTSLESSTESSGLPLGLRRSRRIARKTRSSHTQF